MAPGRLIALAALVAALAIGALLRFDDLGVPSYWLDELLGHDLTTQAASFPWWRWLTGFDREHGPLYYASQLVTRLAGADEITGRAAAAIIGLATIPLVFMAPRALKGRNETAAAVAALLLAVSPLHVYYSREARPYAMLMFLTAGLVLTMLRARRAVSSIGVLVALLYTSAVGATVVAAGGIAAIVAARFSAREERRRFHTIAAAAAVVLLLFPALYRGSPRPASGAGLAGIGAIPADVMRTFSVTALGSDAGGRTAAAVLLFALVGAVVLSRGDRRSAAIVVSLSIATIVIGIAALWAFDHWYAVRYVAAALIGYLILAAVGITWMAESAARVLRGWPRMGTVLSTALALSAAAAIGFQSWDAARREAFQKIDWRSISRTIVAHARPGDIVVAAEPWSEVSLRHYLRDAAPWLRFERAVSPQIAGALINDSEATWLVTAGFTADPSVRDWICRQPLLLASDLEGFRLHYAPSLGHFLRERSGPAEQRALSAALGSRGVTLHMTPEDAFLFGDGWGTVEGEGREAFRWMIGRTATIVIPRFEPRDRVIRMRALPFDGPGLSSQTLRISVNGVLLGPVTLQPGWTEPMVAAPASVWQDGINEIELHARRANAPSSFHAESKDTRELSISFDRISIDDQDAPPSLDRPAGLPVAVRLSGETFLDEQSVWRRTITNFPSSRLRRENVEPLLGRLGIDPLTGWRRLAADQVHLDNLAETIATASGCADDRTFIRSTFATLFNRPPNEAEERGVSEQLKTASRVRVVGRLMKAEEFRREMLR